MNTREQSEKQGTWAALIASVCVCPLLTLALLAEGAEGEQWRPDGGGGGATKGGRGCGAGVLLLCPKVCSLTHTLSSHACMHARARTCTHTGNQQQGCLVEDPCPCACWPRFPLLPSSQRSGTVAARHTAPHRRPHTHTGYLPHLP
jgi:hypothetical protein